MGRWSNDDALDKTRGRHRLHNIGVSRVNRMSSQRTACPVVCWQGWQPSIETTAQNVNREFISNFSRHPVESIRSSSSVAIILTTRRCDNYRRCQRFVSISQNTSNRRIDAEQTLFCFTLCLAFQFYDERDVRSR